MKHGPQTSASDHPWPRWWRMVLVAVCALVLCSCRGPRQSLAPSTYGPAGPPALPREAFTGETAGYRFSAADATAAATNEAANEAVGPPSGFGPWAPPGLRQPWPRDEYLRDGGDQLPRAMVREDWEVRGLNVEDTVAHFDTLDGRRIVEPSNQVYLYSPRFRSVRQVLGLKQDERRNWSSGVHQPLRLVRHDDLRMAASSKQHLQAEAETGRKSLTTYRTGQTDDTMSTRNKSVGFDNASRLAEAPSVIRHGIFEESETAWLAEGINAAIIWSKGQPVQVFIDRTKAAAEVSDRGLQVVYTIKTTPGARPRLRVIKVASTQSAAPGEPVDFTIRFDNVGGQAIGNVTILDNLTTRLEYVPKSAQCSVAADFFTEPNEADSLVLRWEITDPLEPGEGGVIQFRCRVR